MSKTTRRLTASFGMALYAMAMFPARSGEPTGKNVVEPDAVRCTPDEQSALPEPGFSAVPPPALCPPEMVLVEGDFCPKLEEKCKVWPPAGEKHDVCTEFAPPTKCLTETVPLRFCIDKYEYSSDTEKHLPDVLISFNKLSKICDE